MNRPPDLPTRQGHTYGLDGGTLEALKRAFITRIQGGRGIRVREFGQQVIIEAEPRGAGYVAGGSCPVWVEDGKLFYNNGTADICVSHYDA